MSVKSVAVLESDGSIQITPDDIIDIDVSDDEMDETDIVRLINSMTYGYQKDKKKFICDFPECNGSFNPGEEIHEHRREHAGEMLFKCPVKYCKSRFMTKRFKERCKMHPYASLEESDALVLNVPPIPIHKNMNMSYRHQFKSWLRNYMNQREIYYKTKKLGKNNQPSNTSTLGQQSYISNEDISENEDDITVEMDGRVMQSRVGSSTVVLMNNDSNRKRKREENVPVFFTIKDGVLLKKRSEDGRDTITAQPSPSQNIPKKAKIDFLDGVLKSLAVLQHSIKRLTAREELKMYADMLRDMEEKQVQFELNLSIKTLSSIESEFLSVFNRVLTTVIENKNVLIEGTTSKRAGKIKRKKENEVFKTLQDTGYNELFEIKVRDLDSNVDFTADINYDPEPNLVLDLDDQLRSVKMSIEN